MISVIVYYMIHWDMS